MKKHSFYYKNKTKICCKNLVYVKNFKILKKNFKIKNTLRQKIILKLYTKYNRINIMMIRKYCIFTGRLRFVTAGFKYNRLNFRELVSNNYISGMFKK